MCRFSTSRPQAWTPAPIRRASCLGCVDEPAGHRVLLCRGPGAAGARTGRPGVSVGRQQNARVPARDRDGKGGVAKRALQLLALLPDAPSVGRNEIEEYPPRLIALILADRSAR